MTVPKRIQMSRQHPWRAENPDAVRVDRATKWGNPFSIEEFGLDTALRLFTSAALGRWSPNDLDQALPDSVWDSAYRKSVEWRTRLGYHPTETIRAQLAGKDLACWCPLEDADGNRVPCHADVLLKLANREEA